MSTDDETTMIQETVAKFVDRELIPLERDVLEGEGSPAMPAMAELTDAQRERLRKVSKELGLWGLDAPVELGGQDLPAVTMAAVKEEMGRTCVQLHAAAGLAQPAHAAGGRHRGAEAALPEALHRRARWSRRSRSPSRAPAAIRPGMKTRAVLEGDQWVINGRKIWISNARHADFIIVMARVGDGAAARRHHLVHRREGHAGLHHRARDPDGRRRAHLRDRVRRLPHPGGLRAGRGRPGLCADAAAAAAPAGSKWGRPASASPGARST